MKFVRAGLTALAVGFALSFVPQPTSAGGPLPKAVVKHIKGNGQAVVIEVNCHAVPAHVAHGDRRVRKCFKKPPK